MCMDFYVPGLLCRKSEKKMLNLKEIFFPKKVFSKKYCFKYQFFFSKKFFLVILHVKLYIQVL